jgi:hypothetical protein
LFASFISLRQASAAKTVPSIMQENKDICYWQKKGNDVLVKLVL